MGKKRNLNYKTIYIYTMKKLLFILLLSPLLTLAQYRESGDTIFVNNKILLPGDTLHLGMGSDPYKNFVFVTHMPNKKATTAHLLPSSFSLGYLVYKGTQIQKIYNTKIPYKAFWVSNIDNMMSHYVIQLPQAIAAKEIIL